MTAQVQRHVLTALSGIAIVLAIALPAPACAVRPATPREIAAINRLLGASERTLHTRLAWVHISTVGPFALAYLHGPEQVSAILLRGSGERWRNLAAISDEGLRCGLAPAPVIADLQLQRFNEGPKPCAP